MQEAVLPAVISAQRAPIRQRGFGIGYVLAILALASLAAFVVAKTQRGMAVSQFNTDNRTALIDQYTLIRSRVIGCAVSYPAGNNGSGFRLPFPATPASTKVIDLLCPGQPGANNLWSGTGGLTLPIPPRPFSVWTFANDATSMRIVISAVHAGDPAALGVLDAVAARIGPNAVRAGDVLTITLAV